MKLVKVEMAVTLPCMVELVAICDLCDKRTWVFRQGVEKDTVGDDAGDLPFCQLELHLHAASLFGDSHIEHASNGGDA